ncbi:HAD-IIIC family phosphatase [Fibrobacterota bacterium]
MKSLKVALLGDSATQLLSQAIRGYGFESHLNLEMFEADYDQIERQVFDPSSELFSHKPDFVIIFHSASRLKRSFCRLSHERRGGLAEEHIEKVDKIYNSILSKHDCRVIYFNFPEDHDEVFGNYANKVPSSFLYQIRKLNYELMNFSQTHNNLFINDLCALQSRYGKDFASDAKMRVNYDMPFSLEFLPLAAKNIVEIIESIIGRINKCLILDLDNTLWGGVIGDDGMENIQIGDLGIGKAFTELQLWIKDLKKRGVILTVCSKNEESAAKEPFEHHPDMVLRLEDISLFVANWNNKDVNIKFIKDTLHIGYDSMVFLDDSPFERGLVKASLPDVSVPDLPEDPAEYLDYLTKQNLFETGSFSQQDEKRTQQYQQESHRRVAQDKFLNEADFLASLDMIAEVETFTSFNTPRVAQLTQRSNQFNLRTVRYTEDEIARISSSDKYLTLALSLEDKYGDYGLISVVILEDQGLSLFIDTWIMSCRVLKRGMEHFTLSRIVRLARENRKEKIIGEYIPTAKNAIVKDHYLNLGFKNDGGNWVLTPEDHREEEYYINLKKGEKHT